MLRAAPLLLLLALATSATAQRIPSSGATPGVASPELDQVIYKGVVGNVLDGISMDSSDRVDLQRANAIVGSTVSGRSLAVLAGTSNPVLLLVGFVWGVWAAANIKPQEVGMKLTANSGQSNGFAATQARVDAIVAPAAAVGDAPAPSGREPILVSSNSAVDAGEAAPSPRHVVKIWLPQRSSVLPQ
jgi:hypothetical protein